MSEIGVQSLAQPSPGLSQWQRVAHMFSAPSKTFEDIKRGNRSWWLPLIIYALVGYALFAVVVNRIGMQQVVDNQIRLNPKAEERLAQAPPAQREMSKRISLYITEGAFAAGPAFILVGAAVLSLVLWGTINFVFGGKATFSSVFAVMMYGWMPTTIKSILGIITILAGMAPESFNVKNMAPTNLAAFLDPIETNKALYALAMSLDIISIWTMVLVSIGVAVVAGVKRGSGYIAVFGWWVMVVLFSVGIAAITG